jgi:hypothetical protein
MHARYFKVTDAAEKILVELKVERVDAEDGSVVLRETNHEVELKMTQLEKKLDACTEREALNIIGKLDLERYKHVVQYEPPLNNFILAYSEDDQGGWSTLESDWHLT